ncbi:MAG: response regulator [Panacagrimonas sp.]
MNTPLRVLHLEDDPRDAELVQAELEAGGIECEITRVETRETFTAALVAAAPDLILADFSLPSFDGLSALEIAAQQRPEVPFIFVSGTLGEELAIDALKIGATDYVLKERLSRIVSSVRRALREACDRAERLRAEERLRRSEAFLAEGQRISHTGSWGWILSVGEVVWSEEHYRLLGFEPGHGEPSMERFLDAVHPEDRSRVTQTLREATAAQRAYSVDYRVLARGGSIRHLRSLGRPVPGAGGTVDEYLGTTTDISERVEAQEELLRLERKLRQAQRLEAMGTLAGGIAHDFNNILGAILGYGERAFQAAPPGSRMRRDLESVLAAGERGRSLVDRVLAFSRAGEGEKVSVHVEAVIREAIDLVCAKLPPGVTVQTALNAGRSALLGDPTQVHQVLVNLATNAIQAMPSGGTLSITLNRTRIDTPRAANIGKLESAEYIVLDVADTGVGMDASLLERIFDPFFTTKEVGVGTGLGLSLVHGIVLDLGGAIDLSSTPRAGSRFAVYFPCSGEVADAPQHVDEDQPRGRGQRVLFVDDEAALVLLGTETLEALGYKPTGFSSSLAALEAFRSDPLAFDALVTDERMPGLCGSAMIREVRVVRPRLPVLLVSGYVGGSVTTGAYEAGANEVLKKPLSARDLAISLARVLQA